MHCSWILLFTWGPHWLLSTALEAGQSHMTGLKTAWRTRAITSWKSLSMNGQTLSALATLWVFRVPRSFSRPLVEMSNSCMVSYLGSVWSEHSVWSLAGVLGLKTDWNCLLRMCAFSVGLISSLPISGFRMGAMPIEFWLFCLMKVQKRLLYFCPCDPGCLGQRLLGIWYLLHVPSIPYEGTFGFRAVKYFNKYLSPR